MDGLGEPGMPPYTRGIYPDMYKSKLWTMRQYAGFSTSEQTNKRFKMLLDQGQTGLSEAQGCGREGQDRALRNPHHEH